MSLKRLTVFLASTAILALSHTTFANNGNGQMADFRHVDRPIPGQYIVVLKDDVANLAHEQQRANVPSVASVAQAMARNNGMRVERTFNHVLRGFVVRGNERALMRLLEDERVAFIEEDGHVRLNQTTQPNATWGLDRIDQRDLPLDGNYTYDTTAPNVYTYIVDTGVRPNHNDFGNRVTSGFSSINDGRGSDDCNGHGTHVAGTVAGSTWGVAKSAIIVPVRVLNCQGGGTNSGVIAGMDWIASNHTKPAVANMSLGGSASTATDNAVTNMRNAGVTVVVAAGNENQNACNVSPARSADAITVGSTTSNDTRSNFSNWGSCVDIFAPGSNITSAWHTSNSATNTISGTSMAAPHVAGVAALYLADNPNATPAQVENAINDNASTGKLSGLNGSPNRLVYSRFGSGGGPDPDPDPAELENGVAVSNLSGSQGSETFFTLEVPEGAEDLVIEISGGSGDADLYVRYGSPPTQSTYDCRPYLNGNNETCSFDNPQAGTWHIMLHGWQTYSGVTLVGSFEVPVTVTELQPGVPVDNLSGSQASETFFTMEVSDGAEDLVFQMSGGSGDADLYVRFGAAPTTSTYDCRPYLVGNNETCTFDNPQAGTWHVMIRGYEAYSGVTLVGDYEVPSSTTELAKGAPVTGLSGQQGSEVFFTLNVEDGATDLIFDMSGGSGDADLYVRYGAPPTTSDWDCRPYRVGNNETCTFANPQSGTWHVMIRGYEAYSDVSLVGDYTEPSSAPCTNCTQYTSSLSGSGDQEQQPDGTFYQSSAGVHRGWLQGPSNANFDLRLYRWSGSSWQLVASSTSGDSDEYIEYNGSSGYYTWLVNSVSGSGGYDFWLQRP